MDRTTIKALLGLYREGEPDARFEEAKQAAENDPELAAWWAQERALDQAIARHLQAAPVPRDLRARRLRTSVNESSTTHALGRPWLYAAAALVTLALLFGLSRSAFQEKPLFANYRDEMVSFVKLTPSLELESNNLPQIRSFLTSANAPADAQIPPEVAKLNPIGCRVLRFRGEDVTLICFKREDGRLAHIFAVKRSMFLHGAAKPEYAAAGDWMTASWTNGDYNYLLAVQGDRAAAEQLLRDS